MEPSSGFFFYYSQPLADISFMSFLHLNYVAVIAHLLYIRPLCRLVIHCGRHCSLHCICKKKRKEDVLVSRSATGEGGGGVNISVAVVVEGVLSLSELCSITHTHIDMCVRGAEFPRRPFQTCMNNLSVPRLSGCQERMLL